jgi:hypothetical protein
MSHTVFGGAMEEMEPQQRLTLSHMAYFVLLITWPGVQLEEEDF